MNEDKLIPIEEAAELLGITMQTLRRWDKKGILRAIRFTSTSPRKYRESDLQSFIKK